MNGGYESLIWIKDANGKEYVCSLDDIKKSATGKEELSEEEKARCLDVSQLIGTERW